MMAGIGGWPLPDSSGTREGPPPLHLAHTLPGASLTISAEMASLRDARAPQTEFRFCPEGMGATSGLYIGK